MQIALTKKLAKAMDIDLPQVDEAVNPLFSWTANWTTVWDNRRAEDMLVLINNATRFTVAIYQVKRAGLKNVQQIMMNAIKNTLYEMNFNPEMIDAYMQLAGEIIFVQNSDRKAAARVSVAGRDCALYVGCTYNGIEKMYCDTVGVGANRMIVNSSDNQEEAFYPYEKMIKALTELTGKKAYQYRAFELMVTLELDVYQATRKIIVPSNISFKKIHEVLQSVYDWKNYHLYDFTVYDRRNEQQILRIVPFKEDLEYDDKAILMENHILSEFISKDKDIIYTYDMGDDWKHRIELVEVIESYDKESPYLLEANGQAPPEDVGGVSGFIDFREIISNDKHPEYEVIREWAGFWTIELSEWEKKPRLIYV